MCYQRVLLVPSIVEFFVMNRWKIIEVEDRYLKFEVSGDHQYISTLNK